MDKINQVARQLLLIRQHIEGAGRKPYYFGKTWEELTEPQQKDFEKDVKDVVAALIAEGFVVNDNILVAKPKTQLKIGGRKHFVNG